MSSLTDLQETIDETNGVKSSPGPASKGGFVPFLVLPLAFFLALWFYSAYPSPFCTVIVATLLSYLTMGTVLALRGEEVLPRDKPKMPEGIEIPEEFEGHPKLYLAYLIEQAAEQDTLNRIVAARGPGSDPNSKYDRWNIL